MTRTRLLRVQTGADILPVFSPDGKYAMWSSKRTNRKDAQPEGLTFLQRALTL
jgi:WD40-like Beta Propeller Repeat